jgi:predicted amino acid dehydrogenase
MMCRAAQIGGQLDMIGLGSVLAVVAGRGTALQEQTGIPVTTGNAATAWTALTVASAVHESGPIAVLGTNGPVGRAVAALLREEGFTVADDPEDCRPFRLLVGAHTSGGILPPEQLSPGTTLVDVALPPTLSGPAPRGVRMLKGESIALPRGWRRDYWGHLFHLISPFGHQSTYTCLLEPLAAVLTGRREPFAQGRRLRLDAVREFGQAATALGVYPEIKRVGRFSRRQGIVRPRVRPPLPAACELPQEALAAAENVG